MISNDHNLTVGPNFDEPLLISVDELAKILRISPRSIWRLLSAGKLVKPIRLGGSVRWRFHDVKSWIDEGCPPIDVRNN